MVLDAPTHGHALVTGATGFVGQHLVRALLDDDVPVRILARSWERARDIFGSDVERIEVVQGDLTQRNTLRGICDGIQTVFHCAIASLGTFYSGTGQDAFDAINHQGTLHLALEAVQSRVQTFVFTSSTAAMGTPQGSRVDEDSPCDPRNPYQRSKRNAELRLLELHKDAGLNVRIVRPCLVTGPGKSGGELLKLFQLCQKGRFPLIGRRQDVIKPLIDVVDLIQALRLAALKGQPGRTYLVHSDGDHTLEQIIDVAGQLVGKKCPALRIPKPAAWLAAQLTTPVANALGQSPPLSPERLRLYLTDRRIDITRARTELGYQPQMQDLHEMLGRTYIDYLRTGQLHTS